MGLRIEMKVGEPFGVPDLSSEPMNEPVDSICRYKLQHPCQ